jgi:DNA-binding NtrC family response regulator
MVLSDKGHTVGTCMTGKMGLDAIRKELYDVILLDLKLPDMDGMDILQEVRKEKPGIYVIVMTGYATVYTAVEAMKLGAFDYLGKPFSDDELVIAVERAIEKKHLVEENLFLRKGIIDRFGFQSIVGKNPKILRIFDQIAKVAPAESTVLIYGESGTGKELFAKAVHAHSQRVSKQFIAIDCSTLSPGLLESELFGHVKGAFTGAVQDKTGIFEAARGGTLFLDEVGNLTMEIQGKLLRVLEAKEYKPVGGAHFKKTDVRIIAATNQDLKVKVDKGDFREDLYYRLNVFPIFLPPLREREDDIPRLAYHFLRYFCRKIGKRINGFSDDALSVLVNNDWPGNVRQLKNAIERLVIMADDNVLDLFHMLNHLQVNRNNMGNPIPDTLEKLKEQKKRLLEESFGQIEKAFLIKTLKASDGNITHAAEKAGMKRPNFSALMKKHGLSSKVLKQNLARSRL